MLTAVMTCEGGGITDAKLFYGNSMLGLGCNTLPMLGGKNKARGHVDLCLRGCSIYLDETKNVDHGRFTIPELQ